MSDDAISSIKPTDRDVLNGWSIVRTGSVKLGDKYWTYRNRTWMPVTSKQTFQGSRVDDLMTVIIRRDKTKAESGPKQYGNEHEDSGFKGRE